MLAPSDDSPPKKKAKIPEVTERGQTPRRPFPATAIKILSWNVDGLRAKGRGNDLKSIVREENPDIICLQETKLQSEWSEWSTCLPGYDAFWTFSSAQKGYSGTAAFVKRSSHPPPNDISGDGVSSLMGRENPVKSKKTISSFFASSTSTASAPEAESNVSSDFRSSPLVSVRFGIGHPQHDLEGRSITLIFSDFFIVALYVPNSGQTLERLEYRLREWNPALQSYVAALESSLNIPAVSTAFTPFLSLSLKKEWKLSIRFTGR